jgi:hypothetical protein
MLNKINNALKIWNKGHPNLDGTKLIIQMVVRWMTQFLTKAQGMPTHIESVLIETTRNFIWNDARSPPINLEQLYQPKETRGIDLLDIKSRNEAIEITWVKSYLNISLSWPTWDYVIDLFINNIKTNNKNNRKHISNTFLQNWDPPTKGPNTKSLPTEAIKLIQTAKKQNITFAPIKWPKILKNNYQHETTLAPLRKHIIRQKTSAYMKHTMHRL